MKKLVRILLFIIPIIFIVACSTKTEEVESVEVPVMDNITQEEIEYLGYMNEHFINHKNQLNVVRDLLGSYEYNDSIWLEDATAEFEKIGQISGELIYFHTPPEGLVEINTEYIEYLKVYDQFVSFFKIRLNEAYSMLDMMYRELDTPNEHHDKLILLLTEKITELEEKQVGWDKETIASIMGEKEVISRISKQNSSEMSLSQQQAVNKAMDYLAYTSFSKSGLIEQLEFDGFTNKEAKYAVGNITIDWKEQAFDKAKRYMDYSSFSKSGLIEQLEFDGFSNGEATYAVDKIGF